MKFKVYGPESCEALEDVECIVGCVDDINDFGTSKERIAKLRCVNPYHTYAYSVDSREDPRYAESYKYARVICPEKHVDIWEAWNEGAKVEVLTFVEGEPVWKLTLNPKWKEDREYRVAE